MPYTYIYIYLRPRAGVRKIHKYCSEHFCLRPCIIHEHTYKPLLQPSCGHAHYTRPGLEKLGEIRAVPARNCVESRIIWESGSRADGFRWAVRAVFVTDACVRMRYRREKIKLWWFYFCFIRTRSVYSELFRFFPHRRRI